MNSITFYFKGMMLLILFIIYGLQREISSDGTTAAPQAGSSRGKLPGIEIFFEHLVEFKDDQPPRETQLASGSQIETRKPAAYLCRPAPSWAYEATSSREDVAPQSTGQEEIPTEHRSDWVCEFCGKRCDYESVLKKHLLSHGDNRPYPCDQCDKSFKFISHMKRHKLSFHPNERERKSFLCKICSTSFKTLDTLKQHLLTHSNKRPFRCGVCDADFTRKAHLQYHERTHARGLPSGEPICESGSSEHTRPSSGARSASCEFCGKSFSRNSNLRVHMRSHTGEKLFHCEICRKSFTRKTTLDKHTSKAHADQISDEEKLVCEQCSKCFESEPGLRQHLEIHEKGDPLAGPFSCQICGRRFKKEGNLLKHEFFHAQKQVTEVPDVEVTEPYQENLLEDLTQTRQETVGEGAAHQQEFDQAVGGVVVHDSPEVVPESPTESRMLGEVMRMILEEVDGSKCRSFDEDLQNGL